MKYVGLKEKLISEIDDLDKKDFYLLEGKLIFVKSHKANLVKEYLSRSIPNLQIVLQQPRNWNHWNQKYETVMFFKNLPEGLEL